MASKCRRFSIPHSEITAAILAVKAARAFEGKGVVVVGCAFMSVNTSLRESANRLKKYVKLVDSGAVC